MMIPKVAGVLDPGIGGGINFTLKANKSQAKEIKRLLIQKKIQVVLTLADDNSAE